MQPDWCMEMVAILLKLAEAQLAGGFSVIVDSVFMGADRLLAKEVATRQRARLFAIYTHVSDEALWEARVHQRWENAPGEIKDDVATWERIQEQRKAFQPWKPEDALFVDGINAVEDNLGYVLSSLD